MGEQIFTALGRPVPQFYEKLKENKWMYAIGAFFIGSQISSALLSTGAFEIYIDDALVYSKL